MTDTEAINSGNAVPVAPKKSKSKAKKAKNALIHPKISEMVIEAITELKERNGSSLQAIKKYLGANFKVEVEKLSPFIKKYLKTAVIKGVLIQTRGHGATGSFKLSVSQTSSPDKSRSRDDSRKSRIIPVVIKKAPKPKKVAKKTKAKVVEKKIKTAKTSKKLKAKPTPKTNKVKKGKASKGKKSKK